MKNLLFLTLAVFFSTLISSCKNRDSDTTKPLTEIEKLPAATQTGANTAGCLVDGVAFLPKGYSPNGSNIHFNYQDGLNLSLGITENINNNLRSVNVFSLNQDLHDNVGVTFQLTEDNGANSKYGAYLINATPPPSQFSYETTSTVIGELKITYHNYNQAIMSGTFWFDAVNSKGEKVQVREGRFDMHY